MSEHYEWDDQIRRERLIGLLAPIAAAAGAGTVENIINTAVKLERYIKTGENPLQPMIIGHDFSTGPINSDEFEAQIEVDENGQLTYA